MTAEQVKQINKEIGEVLAQWGIDTDFLNYRYLTNSGEKRLLNHNIQFEKLLENYNSEGEVKLSTALENLIWYYEAQKIYRGGIHRHFSIAWNIIPNEKLMIHQTTENINERMDKKRWARFTEHVGKRGYKQELKRIHLLFAFNPELAHEQVGRLMETLNEVQKPSFRFIQADLLKKIEDLLEKKLQQLVVQI